MHANQISSGNPRLKTAAGLLAAPLLAFSASAQASTAVTAEQVKGLEERIENYIVRAMDQWKTPGLAIGIVAEDRLVYAKGFGIRKVGEKEPVTEETLFEIGSTTKAFVGVTQAIQVDDGAYGWDDRVIDLEPGFRLYDPWVTREFRIADLLAQRSGLPAYALTDMSLYGYDEEATLQGLRHIKPISSFRSSFAYQNAFHLLAGQIIARSSGEKTWGDVARKRLLEPLGMKSTTDRMADILKHENVASGHRFQNGQVEPDPRSVFPYNVVPAGGLNSSVRDMGQWLRLQINLGEVDGKRLVSEENLIETRTPRVPVVGALAKACALSEQDEMTYATGWILHSMPEGRAVEHGGSTGGSTAFVGFDPDRRVGVVVLSNLAYSVGSGSAHGVGPYILGLLQGREPLDKSAELLEILQKGMQAELERDAQNPIATGVKSDAYAGKYESPVLGSIELKSHDDGSLTFELGPHRVPGRLSPVRPHYYRAEVKLHSDYGEAMSLTGDALFTTDKEGRPDGFLLDTMDSAAQPSFQRVE